MLRRLTRPPSNPDRTGRIDNVLFLCVGNSARSIMVEALLNVLGEGRFKAWSAGSHPSGKVQPIALELARSIGYDTARVRSKSWDEDGLCR